MSVNMLCGIWIPPATIISLAVLLRLGTSLHPYSGSGKAPHFGDYEAQRHWMELTTSLPLKDWYRNTNDNTLGYWGLDYPPLTAYQSWLCGKVLGHFEPAAMALHSSRGYETVSSKLLMRLSVLAFDLLVLVPAFVAASIVFGGPRQHDRCRVLAAALLQPAALLIDHGHFQYNNISLGLAAAAAAAIGSGRELLGSCLFCLALNHKQMALYYAPAFFAHLLGSALQHRSLGGKTHQVELESRALQMKHILKLGAVVVATFAAVWAPFLGSKEDVAAVLRRLAPINRGLFEDYVANFWCVSSLAVKWKRLFGQQALVKIAGAATLVGILPAMLQQILRPSRKGLLYCMANTAFVFFMFSYQVHEKSVLLPLMPATLLAADEPALAAALPPLAAFSMFPLLARDGLPAAYAATLLFWAAWFLPSPLAWRRRRRKDLLGTLKPGRQALLLGILAAAAGVHLLAALTSPPKRLPFLHDALFVTLSAPLLCLAAAYLNLRQWQLRDTRMRTKTA